MSGASVTLAEDRPGVMEKVVRISGTPEQADKAQSLLQGFILSSESLLPLPLYEIFFFASSMRLSIHHLHSEILNACPLSACPVQDDIPSG